MRVIDDLKAEFKTRYPTLEAVSERFLGMSKREAYRAFNTGKLPFPVFRLVKSQRAPLVVDIAELAKHMERCAMAAKEQFE